MKNQMTLDLLTIAVCVVAYVLFQTFFAPQ